jgi:hypothetical protein
VHHLTTADGLEEIEEKKRRQRKKTEERGLRRETEETGEKEGKHRRCHCHFPPPLTTTTVLSRSR